MNITPQSTQRSAGAVFAICWLLVVCDGYDLIVYGTTVPAMLNDPDWGLSVSRAGFVGSIGFAGMMVGALVAGRLSDLVGRRRTIIGCAIWFSILTALCAAAPTPAVFAALRFLAGLGLGGLVPSANALAAEFVSPRRRPLVATAMMSGVPLGGCLAAITGLGVIDAHGWRTMYALALVALVVIVPVAVRLLPESPAWLDSRGQQRVDVTNDTIFAPQWRQTTILLALATMALLFTWYGLGTWLPRLMARDGLFDLGEPLQFLLALNLGAVAGSALTAWAAVRFGAFVSAYACALMAAVALASLLTYPSERLVVYAAIVLAGVGTHGAACLLIAGNANHFPAALRGTSLGFSLGVGRIGAVIAPTVGGWVLSSGFGVSGNFAAFSVAAALGAAALLGLVATTPRQPAVLTPSREHSA